MTLSSDQRTSLRQTLAPITGQEAIDAMLDEFPTDDRHRPASEAFVHAEIATLRTELNGDIATLRTDLQGEIATLRTELNGDIATLRTEFKGDIATLRTDLRGEIAALRTELVDRIGRASTESRNWIITSMLGGFAIVFVIGRALQ